MIHSFLKQWARMTALSLVLYTYFMINFRALTADVPHILYGRNTLGISPV